MTCTTASCKTYSILASTSARDSTNITLIEGTTITESDSAYLVCGQCTHCHTLYHPDHENYTPENGQTQEVFINSARYLKIGDHIWIDRVFSNAVLGGMYNFHASASAYMQYWNECFGSSTLQLSRRHIWQAFTQKSIRSIAQAKDVDFEAERELHIDKLVDLAFQTLGDEGRMPLAKEHSCSECTKPRKPQPDQPNIVNAEPCKMVVIDGAVMGPVHCAFENCANDLANARGGAFCHQHEEEYGL
ncbi:hypothetical protein BDN70DRAFT_902190, partial [Pholiota conissans]